MIKVEKRIHQGYREYNHMLILMGKLATQYFAKNQYIVSSPKGRISCAGILSFSQKIEWEIYCLEGNLFEDVIRCSSEKDVIKKAKEFLK